MGSVHAERALTPQGWCSDVRLTMEGGRFSSVAVGVPPQPGDERHRVALPGMPNLHSHAFQRGMAGLAEVRGESADSFWSWRTLMYRFALSMTPDHLEAVAGQLYMEMLEAGFTRVGEFHYLHHDIDGQPYAHVAEMASRIAAAAEASGIGLTLLPVFYAHSDFGGAQPAGEQRRFVNDLDGFARLLDGCRVAVAPIEGAVVGVAPHSLRAVTPVELEQVAAMAQGAPLHIHVAEQVKEVEDCLSWCGARPVAWLLDHAPVGAGWCLVHATHMNAGETERLARSGAVAGLCPITEANLGDGIFDAKPFVERGGRFGVGSDSNVLIGVADELRQLEYSQRLLHRARNVLASAGASTGRALFDAALDGGARALGSGSAGLATGAVGDLVTLDPDNASLQGRRDDSLIDTWIFAGDRSLIDCVWSGGRKCVESGRHYRRDAIARSYRAAVAGLSHGN